MTRKTIYLAGPILDCTDPECNDWRETVKKVGGKFDFLNPMSRDYRGRTDECYKEIVEGDKADIDNCDILMANCSKNSAGTSMEVMYAWEKGKTVITFGGHSPWIKYHSTTVLGSLETAINSLK